MEFLDKDGVTYLWGKISETFKKKEASVSISASPKLFEKGVDTEVTVSWSSMLDGAKVTPTSTTITQGSTQISTAANSSVKVTVADSATFSISSVIKGVTKTASTSVAAVYPMYFGDSAKAALASADILALTKQSIQSSPKGSYTVAVAANNYMWLCVPSTMSITKVTSSGFDVPLEAPVTVAVTDKGDYKCYRSSAAFSEGDVNIVIA